MWEEIHANHRRAGLLVAAMAGLLLALGYCLGESAAPGLGWGGLGVAFIVWLIQSSVAYFAGDKVFLALSGARRIEHKDHPVLFNVVEEMKIAAGLSHVPEVYLIDSDAPNAFATGRGPERSAIAVTSGLLKSLTRDELQGVIGHEMAHVANRDVFYMTMVGVLAGSIVLLADIGMRSMRGGGGRSRTSSRNGGQAQAILFLAALALIILAPIIAQLIYLAVSRRREYLADACGAQFTRYPEGLASALEKLARNTQPLRAAGRVTAPLFIVNPLNVTKRGLSDLTSTHPPISERINILRAMAGAGLGSYDESFRKVTGRAVGVVPFSALEKAPAVAKAAPAAAPAAPIVVPLAVPGAALAAAAPDEEVARARQTTDMLWKLNGYCFVACACGTTLKVPKPYAGRTLACPHCAVSHAIPLHS